MQTPGTGVQEARQKIINTHNCGAVRNLSEPPAGFPEASRQGGPVAGKPSRVCAPSLPLMLTVCAICRVRAPVPVTPG